LALTINVIEYAGRLLLLAASTVAVTGVARQLSGAKRKSGAFDRMSGKVRLIVVQGGAYANWEPARQNPKRVWG
jgi:hypothetical protein